MRSNTIAIVLVLIAAAGLRVLRMHVRWDELTLAYAAYPEPLTLAIEQGHPTALFGSWIGLHPPLWGVLHAVSEVLTPIPWVWMGMSVLASLLAVAAVGRVGGVAAAMVLGSAPVHLLDSAEVNNYPMASLSVAMLLFAASRPWPLLVLAAIFAGWTHLLSGLVAVAVIGWRVWTGPISERYPVLIWSFLGLLPVAAGAVRLMGQGSTWSQPEVSIREWAALLMETVGAEGVLLAPLVLMGLVGVIRASWMTLCAGLLLAVWMGAAAAHQRPYLGLVAPIAAMAVGETVRRHPKLLLLVAVLCGIRGARFAVDDANRLSAVMDDLTVTRAVDVAIDTSNEGDTIWLISPALQADDDKTATGSVMWRFRPWERMPIARPVMFEYKDYRYGQPRMWRQRTIHSSTELDSSAFDHVAQPVLSGGHRVWIVVYDHGPAAGLVDRIERTLQPYQYEWSTVGSDVGLGVDRVAVVEGLR